MKLSHVGGLVNLPAVAIGDLVSRWTRWWFGLVAAVVSALALLAAYAWALRLLVHTAPSDTAIVWGVAVSLMLLPLLVFAGCAYWSGALLALIARSRRQPKS